MKNNRHGQAPALSDAHCAKIRSKFLNPQHRLIWDIARWTGERWGAILQLQVSDVYGADGRPLECITFRAQTTKASPDGKKRTRQVPTHPVLKEILLAYKPSTSCYLFPGPDKSKPLTLRAADLALRHAVELANLQSLGISTHSTRVTFITNLHNRGISERIIQQLTGHKDIRVVGRYIVVSADQAKAAIATL